MSSIYGENLKLSIFGQSHGAAVGMTLDAIPAGQPVDFEALQSFLNRRSPGQTPLSSGRQEADIPEFLSGIVDGFTCGAPIAAMIKNTNAHSGDYDNLKDCPRPGHADYTAHIKYGGYEDAAGGGHFSGRLTAPLCIAGGLCKQWLENMNIQITAEAIQIGTEHEKSKMEAAIADAKKNGDSVGGKIRCTATGLPAGLGEPMFGGVESRIAQIIYGIPAVKALEFGDGTALAAMRGSKANDAFVMENGTIKTCSNHCGGILGGITNGMPLCFTVTVKPTPSIAISQQTVSLHRMENTVIQVSGRHDACIVPRAVAVVEAAAAIAIYDMILGNTQAKTRK